MDTDPTTYAAVSSREVSPAAPEWFHRALARPRTTGSVVVEGATVRYLRWGSELGSTRRPTTGPAPDGTVVLVHGGAAHAMWWAPLAAVLAPERTVVAMDLSGHGTSDWRDTYAVEQWAREVTAVASAVSRTPPVVVGHSLGGIVLGHAAVASGELFERVVLVDAPVWPGASAPEGDIGGLARPPRTHPDLDAAMARFRLVPPQPCENRWYVDHVARHGLTAGPDGWRWRFDPRIFAEPTRRHGHIRFEADLEASRCPWALVMGADSYLAPGALAALGHHATAPLRTVAGARHHVMLDAPEALTAELQDLLGGWTPPSKMCLRTHPE